MDQKIQNILQCRKPTISQNYRNCKKKLFLRKFGKLTKVNIGQSTSLVCVSIPFVRVGASERMLQRGGWPPHYNRPRATSGIHGVAGRVRYRLYQCRGDRKSMPSPSQVADVPLCQLETKCFNILTQVSQTTDIIRRLGWICFGNVCCNP